MLKLHTLAEWMHGFLDPERPYGLPEEVYNDVIPSGVHRSVLRPIIPGKHVPCRCAPASARDILRLVFLRKTGYSISVIRRRAAPPCQKEYPHETDHFYCALL